MASLFTNLVQKVVISRKWTENGPMLDRERTDEVAEKSVQMSAVLAMLWVKCVNCAKSVMQIFATFASANFEGKASCESTVRYRERSRIPSCLFRYSLDSHLSRFSLASLICLCMLTVGVGNAWGTEDDEHVYNFYDADTYAASKAAGWAIDNDNTNEFNSTKGAAWLRNNCGVAPTFTFTPDYPVKQISIKVGHTSGTATTSITISVDGDEWKSWTGLNTAALTDYETDEETASEEEIEIATSFASCTKTGRGSFCVYSITLIEGSSGGGSTPTISTSSTMTTFGCNMSTGVPVKQSFSVSGTALTNNVTITPPSGYEVCLTENGTYTSSVELSKGSGTLSSTTIYVKLKDDNAAGSYSGNISCVSSGATTKNVAVSGSTPFKVTWKANGTTHATTYVTYATGTGTALGSLPDDPDPSDYTCSPKAFYGWYEGESYSNASVAPNVIRTSTKITTDKTYNAVFATASGGAATWDKVTTLAGITAGIYVIINNSKYLPSTATGSTTPPSQAAAPTITGTQITGTVTDAMKWYFTSTGTANQFYIQNEDDDYLYETNANNGLRVGSTSDKWTFAANTLPAFSLQGANNSRYCATYEPGSDWRSYTTADASNYGDDGKVYLYKLTGGTTYSNYATTCCTPLGSINGSVYLSN